MIRTAFCNLGQPFREIVVIPGCPAGKPIRDSSQRAVIIILISDLFAVFIGQLGKTSVTVIGILYTISIAIVKSIEKRGQLNCPLCASY